ncbi:putative reverse transcriptase domain-containing protein, partial [Tanacetum coccineum]
TINDYHVLSTLCGCPYSGFKGCVVYGKDTHCVRLSASSKQRYNILKISGEKENEQTIRPWKTKKIREAELRYWRHNFVPHCIDFMHVEKNVCESLVGTLLNVPGKTKDEMNARLDMADLGIKPELFARQEEGKTTLPPAGYTLMNAEKDIFCETLSNIRVERELAISKDSVSETLRWISYGPRATIVKYEAYNINGYTFRTKSNDGIIYQNSGVNHKAGGAKHDLNLGYTLVDLNSLGHKDDPFILASQARQVFYVKDQIDKKLSIVFRTPTKNYKDTYDKVDEEFSTVIHEHNDNILPRVNRRDLGNESQNDYYRTDCEEPI